MTGRLEVQGIEYPPDNVYYKEMFEELSNLDSHIGALTSEFYAMMLGMVLLSGPEFLKSLESIAVFKSYSAELLAIGIEHGRRLVEVETLEDLREEADRG